MGLDMYLSKRIYTHQDEDAGYWRKANHIHNWMVENVQNGVDDCGDYLFTKEHAQQLLDVCKEVMANPEKAEELLPTTQGFFFGGTEYEEPYFEDVVSTIKTMEALLATKLEDSDSEREEFRYQSSW